MDGAEAALQPLGAMLAAEDYHLHVDVADHIILTVTAGPDACDYCLVPKTTFASLAHDHLEREGVTVDGDLEIRYPGE